MEIYTDATTAQDVIKISESFGIEAKVIGRCEAFSGKKVSIFSEKGEFFYQ
jgi:phosphoribosylformylglycinamidine cyclo-ligase